MDHRERVLTALEHRTPDRPPLGGSFEREIWSKLSDHYAMDPESILRHFGIDFRQVGIADHPTTFNDSIWNYMMTSKALPDGTFEDMYGVRRKWVTSLPGHSPHYVIVYHPLENVQSPGEYEWPEVPDPTESELAQAAENVRRWQEEGFAVAMDGITNVYEHAWIMRGFRKFHTDLYTDEKFVRELLDILRKRYLKRTKFLAQLQPDIIEGGEDWGTQTGMVIRPDHWRKYFKPILQESIEAAKRACGAYVSFHSDGKIDPIIPDLIEIGVDILNPIQPDCMDPAGIKRLYGDKLTLEGAISVQETLPFGTAEQVRAVVRETIDTCGHDGGLILRPTHVVEPPTPIENVIALYETAQTYRPSWAH